MAKDNTDEQGAKSAGASDAAAILEFLPDAADLLREKSEIGELKSETVDADPDAEAKEADDAGEDQAGAEADKAEEADEDEKPAGSEKVQKRIDKLTARAKTAEEKANAAEVELEKARAEAAELREAGGRPSVVAAPSAANPLSDVSDPGELASRVNNAVVVKRWCIENPDGGTVKDKDGGEVEFESAQVRKMLADAEEIITVHAPRRERFLVENEQHGKVAREVYPDMFKRGTEMEKAFQNLVKAWPEVTRFPDYHLVLGDYLAGFNARGGKKAAAAEKPAMVTKKPAIAPPVPKVSAPKPRTNGDRGSKLGHVIERGGSLEALEEYFQS
ncbi:MAG: hypothetical protein WCS65_15675 [Verrucomicrobiae bacterium]